MQHRIIVNNLGYARNIDGAVRSHLRRAHRHFSTSHAVQKASLDAYRAMIMCYDPHLCCILEIDTGSYTSKGMNQFDYIADDGHPYRDVCGKYALGRKLSKFALTQGKSNGFMAKRPYKFERLYLSLGSKRLVYRMELEENLILYFTHLSLKFPVRKEQMRELRALADRENGEVIIAGDFNILAGLDELEIFIGDGRYKLINKPEEGTFTLFGRHYLLDICLATQGLAGNIELEIIDQPFSDHDALFIKVGNP